MSDHLPTVLCVDDEPSILEAVTRTLRQRFHIVCCSSAKEGLEFVENHPETAIVLSDYLMPEINGVEFLSKVKNRVPLASRVLLSGQIDIKNMEEAINSANIHKFIMKPWENAQLLIHIIEAFKQHKMLKEREKLKTLSITDPVTQLTNHRFFQENLRLEWSKNPSPKNPLSLIMVDIDHFKKFNDRFGHPVGDKILAQVAQTLLSNTPQMGSLSRYGGEEFAVILPKTSSAKAYNIAETLRKSVLEQKFSEFPISVSLGVASAPEHASSVNELIISADQSLYQAKRRGRNQTVVGLNFEI